MLVLSSILPVLGLLAMGGLVAGVYVMLLRRPGPAAASARRPVAAASRPMSLRAVIDRLAEVGDEESVLLDRSSGRFVKLADPMLAALEGNELIEDLVDDTVALSETQLEDLRRKLRAKQLLPLPTKAETREFQLRERFCAELPDGEAKEEMAKVMRGQTGYRSFAGAVTRLQIVDKWQHFRDAGFAPVVVEWCQRHSIPFVRDFVAQSDTPELRKAG